MKNKYVIVCRYEHYSVNGKQFTEWFVEDTTPRSLEDANTKTDEFKNICKEIDNKTKLKHEYDIKSYEEYLAEIENIKNKAIEAARKYEEYKKSDEYKEMLKKKRQAAKELKERQKKYAEEHGLL